MKAGEVDSKRQEIINLNQAIADGQAQINNLTQTV